ncbi:MAG: PGF-pre-PGF domain-containing protein, partial [Candidatus Woesearchaeota archaeon]
TIYDSGSNLRFPMIDVYNAVNAKGIISTNVSAVPFYTLSANPSNATCLDWLTDGQTCNITWAVNTTGDANTTWEFFAAYIGKYNYNTTPLINITILDSYVTLLKASDFYNGPNMTLNCSAYSAYGLMSNITLYTNVEGTWLQNATMNVSSKVNESNFSLYNLADGSYIWNCLARDTNNLAIWASQNYTLNVDTVNPSMNYINKTSIISFGSYHDIYINATDAFMNSVNISIAGQNITLSNWTASQYNYSRFDYANGTVNFTIFAMDRAGNLNVSYDSYFVNDTTNAPEIYSVAISNSTLPYGSQQTISSIVLEGYRLTSVLLDHNGTNVTMNNLSSYNYSYSWNTSQCGNINYKVYAQNILNYSALYTSTFNTTGCCGNSVCESGESCSSCSTDCGACASSTASSGGGGGGGGGGLTKPLSYAGFMFNEATTSEPISISVNSELIPVKDIEISLLENAKSVKVEVDALAAKPEDVPSAGTVVSYVKISSRQLENKVASAKIDFEVPESVLEAKFIDPENIVLMRYTDSWNELPTLYLGKALSVNRYSALTPGFSYFAIAETSKPVVKAELSNMTNIAGNAVQEKPVSVEPIKDKIGETYLETDMPNYSMIILAIVIVGLVLVLSFHPIKRMIVRRMAKGKKI